MLCRGGIPLAFHNSTSLNFHGQKQMIKLQTKKLLLLWHLLTADNKTPGWMEEGGGDKEILKNVLIILK